MKILCTAETSSLKRSSTIDKRRRNYHVDYWSASVPTSPKDFPELYHPPSSKNHVGSKAPISLPIVDVVSNVQSNGADVEVCSHNVKYANLLKPLIKVLHAKKNSTEHIDIKHVDYINGIPRVT